MSKAKYRSAAGLLLSFCIGLSGCAAAPLYLVDSKGDQSAGQQALSFDWTYPQETELSWTDHMTFHAPLGSSASGSSRSESKNRPVETMRDPDAPAAIQNLDPISSLAPQPRKKRTILVYMVGSDLESSPRGKAGSLDLEEMMTSNFSAEDVNLVVYTGGAATWWNGLPSDTNCYLVYRNKDDESNFGVLADQNRNMAEPETLSTFLKTADELFPAEQTSLILWDHGSGPYMGYGQDETFEPAENEAMNTLSLLEIAQALQDSPFGSRKLEILGFDACLMASVETAAMLSDYAKWMVASAETEPGMGWDYTALSCLDNDPDTQTLARALVDGYAGFLDDLSTPTQSFEYVLSVMDLSKTDRLEKAYSSLLNAINSSFVEQGAQMLPVVLQTAAKTKYYGGYPGLELLDSGHLASNLYPLYPEEATELVSAIQDMLTYGVTSIPECSGMMAWFPAGDTTAQWDVLKQMALNEGTLGQDAMNLYSNVFLAMEEYSFDESTPGSASGRSASLSEDKKTMTVALPEELYSRATEVTMTILSRSEKPDSSLNAQYEYLPLVEDIPLSVNENGEVSFEADPNIICALAGDDDENPTPIRVRMTGRSALQDKYQTIKAALQTSDYSILSRESVESLINLSVREQICSITGVLHNTGKEEEEEELLIPAGKQDISLEGLNLLRSSMGRSIVFENDDASIPWSEATSSVIVWKEIPYDDALQFSAVPISEWAGSEFSWQILAKDSQGQEKAAAFGDFPSQTEYTRISTPRGEFGFTVEEDHAELAYYRGRDRDVVIPSEVEGKPVTKIQANSFHHELGSFSGEGDCRPFVRTLVIPDSVTSIGHGAFQEMSELYSVSLPSHLESISDNLFRSCSSLKNITLPSGIRSIGSYAFFGTALQSLEIPSSVEEIEKAAFSNCRILSDLKSSSSQFSTADHMLIDNNTHTLISTFGENSAEGMKTDSIVIPEGVEIISPAAFSGWGNYAFTIGYDENTLNEGLQHVQFPSTLKEIRQHAFVDCISLKEIRLPDALERIEEYAFGASLYSLDSPDMQVTIPASVSYVGHGAFSQFDGIQIQTAAGNRHFSSQDGVLYNLSGDQAISVFDENCEVKER